MSDSGRPIGRPVEQVRVGHQRLDRADARLAVPPSLLAMADEMIEQRCCLLQCMSPFVADFVAEVAEERGKLGLGAEMEP